MEPMNTPQEARDRITYNYRFGSAAFDEARFELQVAGLPVDVEPRALEVLAYLLRHAGEVVTKDELLREVWSGRVTVDKVLPNAITKLRRALGATNAEHLVTQSRVGYRLDGPITRTALGHSLTSRIQLEAGQPVPARANFTLRRQLGSTHGSEVWLAEQVKTGAVRVYKFSIDGERLRSLKREATLARVLREGSAEREHFVELIDWNFEQPPFFLECEYGGRNLLEWAETELSALDPEQRVAVFLQIADAVAAAHRLGVLHKDLKPANVLVAHEQQGWKIRLTDFGSGRLLDPDQLDALGITRSGLTLTENAGIDSTTGTPLYIAPEIFDGHLPTVQSDVYALGIMLYQLQAGSLNKPMASGWEQDIADDLLRADIHEATDGDPRRRFVSVDALIERLRHRDQRRDHAAQAARAAEQSQRERALLLRSRAQRPYLVALVVALVVGVFSVFFLYESALRSRDVAERELARANALNRFLNEDLIGRSNPLVVAKGQSASLKDILLGARDRAAKRFAAEPQTEATIHTSLAMLLNMIELLPEAESEARLALALYEREQGAESLDALKARTLLARLLTRTSKFDEALAQLHTLDRLTVGSQEPYRRYLVASAWGVYHMNRADFAKAVPLYRSAIPLLFQSEPENVTLRDSMRIDLVNALTQTGELDEARREGQALIDEIGARSDDNGLVAAFAKAALARTYTLDGDLVRAEAGLLEAQATIVSLLGVGHTRNLMVLSDLFDIAVRRKQWPQARDYAQRVHEGFLATLGAQHNITNLTLINWGQVLYESGDVGGAETRLRTAHRHLAAQLAETNPQRQLAAFWLAAVDIELGMLDEAARLLEPLQDATLEAAGADGLWEYRLDALRGLLAIQRGQSGAAAPLLRSAVEGFEKKSATEMLHDKAKRALASKTRS